MINAKDLFGLSAKPVNYHPEKQGYALLYSDGIKAMIEHYKVSWIIDFIALNKPTKFKKAIFLECIIQKVRGRTFTISLYDPNNDCYHITRIVDTILACDAVTLWLVNGLLMFPAEYQFTD